MNFRNISSWCIRNPVPPIVFFLGLLIAGVVSFMGMQVNNNPDIDFPAAQVNISQPGAAPSEMETQITQRVESAIRGVNGVDEINSSIREGNSNTFVQFEIGTPTDRAVNDIRDAIAQIRGDLTDPDILGKIKDRLRVLLKQLIAQRTRLQRELAKCEEIGSDPILR